MSATVLLLRLECLSLRSIFNSASLEFLPTAVVSSEILGLYLLKTETPSGDPNLISLFQKNSDIYVDIASAVLCKNPSLVTSNERTQFKTVVLGIIYGIGPKALSTKLSLSITECQQMIQKFLTKFPQIQEFMSKSVSQAQHRGFVQTIHGRRRLLEDIKSSDPAKRSYAERQSVNTIIQGSAADIVKATTIRTYEYLRERKLFPESSRLILQLHDELYVYVMMRLCTNYLGISYFFDFFNTV
jgi:DNA polymerase-1